jgi:hypothetical protein
MQFLIEKDQCNHIFRRFELFIGTKHRDDIELKLFDILGTSTSDDTAADIQPRKTIFIQELQTSSMVADYMG